MGLVDLRKRALVRSLLRVARGVALVAIITAVCYSIHLNAVATSWVFLITIVLQSLDSGFWESAAVSVFATASLDYFFTEPLLSLNVENPLDAVNLSTLLVVSLVITRIQSRSRAEALKARLQRDTMEALYKVGQDLLAVPPEGIAGRTILEPFLSEFHLSAVCLFHSASLECHTAGKSNGDLEAKTRAAYIAGEDAAYPDLRILVRCLRAGGPVKGAIGFEGLANPELAAPPLAAFASAAIERAEAFQSATTAAAHAQTETLRSAILDGLAHEFKTPLATILTAAGGLRATGSMQPEQIELAEMIEEEAARLGDLTSRLMRLARLDREELKPRIEPVDAAELIEMSMRRYSKIWPDRRIRFRKLGDTSEVRVDPELIGLAVSQLLENACLYSRPESAVILQLTPEGESVAITVWSDAPPIPKGEREHIFQRFYRGAAASRVAGGSGLGLYIARKIALAHGGDLALLDATPGMAAGVSFRLTIPAASREAALGA